MKKHELKTWPVYFEALWDERKRFEIRKNDRDYREGDELLLREYDPERGEYSGREIEAKVTYVLQGAGSGSAKNTVSCP